LTLPSLRAKPFFGFSTLAVCIKLGNPRQNGRHECIHLTLKKEPLSPRPSTSFSTNKLLTKAMPTWAHR